MELTPSARLNSKGIKHHKIEAPKTIIWIQDAGYDRTKQAFEKSLDAKFLMTVGILTMFFCRIALAYLLGIYFHMGMFGTWVAMFIDWIVKSIIFISRYLSGKWTTAYGLRLA